jgi:NAD(P)-dependent dehydrogenase (short-subunit alcohol dehydrogenase family)
MRTILITGSYRGLGLATAKMLTSRGHRVFLTARDAGKVEQAARDAGGEPLVLDVTSEASRASAAGEVARKAGGLDVLINNAAVLLDGKTDVLELTSDDFARTLETNAVAPLRVAQTFLPLLRKSKAPRIVNVSSGAGQMSGEMTPWAPAYCASKAALNVVTRQLAAALPGVAVNSVCPGWCRTEMGGPQAPRSPEDGADTIAWLAADAPQELTGRFFRDRAEIPW